MLKFLIVTPYDTTEDELHKETFRPPADLIHPSKERVKEWANFYLKSLSDPSTSEEYTSIPLEFILADELSNPHSRAVKQRRWQKLMAERKADRQRLIALQMKKGGTKRDAIAIASYKFREVVKQQDQAKRKKRWVQSGGQQRLIARQQKKARKHRALLLKMSKFTLEPSPNQVIPLDPSPLTHLQL